MEPLSELEITKMIHKGKVFSNVEGTSLLEIFEKVSKEMDLPNYLTPNDVYQGLKKREELLSTAVGYGICIPHSSNCLIKEKEQQSISVVYLKEPIKVDTPDLKPVNTLFIVLAMNSVYHRKTVSALATLFRNIHFRNAINNKVSEAVLSAIINNL